MPSVKERDEQVKTAIEITTKIGLLFLVLYVSFLILKPFLPIVLWGIVLAVAFEPLVEKLLHFSKSRKKVVFALTIVLIALLIVPTWLLSSTIVENAHHIAGIVQNGKLSVVEPTQKVKEWPIIGDKVYQLWMSAHNNLTQTLAPFTEQIKMIVGALFKALKHGMVTVLLTIASLILAAYFLITKEQNQTLFYHLMQRLLGKRGNEWADISVLTVRSVVTGVVGVAVIQAFFALIGMVAYGIPFAPLWAVVIMFITIIQLPTLIVIGPMLAYAFSQDSGTTTIIFTVYMLVVGSMDGILKPLLMGRGVNIPMVVILIGAIGGMLLMGMLGLFLGAVIFALSYKLFVLWLEDTTAKET